MFDQFKGMAGLAGIMKDLPRIKEKMEQVKQRLGAITVDAETGGGAVRATVDGQMNLVNLEVNQTLLAGLVDTDNADDRAMAQDLIVGAVNAAMAKAREAAQDEIQKAADELGIPVPAGGLGGLLT